MTDDLHGAVMADLRRQLAVALAELAEVRKDLRNLIDSKWYCIAWERWGELESRVREAVAELTGVSMEVLDRAAIDAARDREEPK
jgi:hypothetical protein